MAAIIITSEKEDLALKLPIEAALAVAFGKLFRRIAKDFKTVFSVTGETLDASVYDPEVVAILRPAYRRAGRTAGKGLRANKMTTLSFPADNEKETNEAIDMGLLRFSEDEPEASASIIADTTNRQLRDFVLQAIISGALAGVALGNDAIATMASRNFINRSRSRSRFIAMRETLNAVEGARLIEINGLIEADAEIKAETKQNNSKPLSAALFREWIARVDDWENVRPTHKAAHGRKVSGTGTPFQVGGSLLMYPGDTSLGATMEEVAGCRCFAATGIGL